MSSYVNNSILRQTSEATSYNTMFCFDNCGSLSGRESNRYEGANVNGICTSPVPANSVEREEMKTSLRGNTDIPRPSGPELTMVSCSSVDASGFNYGSNGLLGKGTDRDMERSEKSTGKTEENERKVERMHPVKRNTNFNQQLDSEQRPQIYPWMTKLHMSHGKVSLFSKVRRCFPHSLCRCSTSFAHSHFPLEFYRPNAGNNKNSRS